MDAVVARVADPNVGEHHRVCRGALPDAAGDPDTVVAGPGNLHLRQHHLVAGPGDLKRLLARRQTRVRHGHAVEAQRIAAAGGRNALRTGVAHRRIGQVHLVARTQTQPPPRHVRHVQTPRLDRVADTGRQPRTAQGVPTVRLAGTARTVDGGLGQNHLVAITQSQT